MTSFAVTNIPLVQVTHSNTLPRCHVRSHVILEKLNETDIA